MPTLFDPSVHREGHAYVAHLVWMLGDDEADAEDFDSDLPIGTQEEQIECGRDCEKHVFGATIEA